MNKSAGSPAPQPKIDLNTVSEEELLSARICDLPLTIEGTWLQECVTQLDQELEAKGITYYPLCYLAEEWLTPENEPVIGIPFYLAHPVLIRLEKKMMLEAEGETKDWCMKLLRHEAGHALCYAYKLNRKRKFRELFGSSSQKYGDTYRFRPYSKNYVRHLEGFYAQYHPDEDFVETFAVWFTPGENWKEKYKGWKAYEKLEYVDKVMQSIAGKPALVSKGRLYWQWRGLSITLRNFYKKRQKLNQEDFPDFHDGNLKRIFKIRGEETRGMPSAREIIKKYRREILNDLAHWTGEKKYIAGDLLKTINKRCRELRLVAADPEPVVVMKLIAYLTTLIMNYRYTGWFRGKRTQRLSP